MFINIFFFTSIQKLVFRKMRKWRRKKRFIWGVGEEHVANPLECTS
jgi:hypothetical protein